MAAPDRGALTQIRIDTAGTPITVLKDLFRVNQDDLETQTVDNPASGRTVEVGSGSHMIDYDVWDYSALATAAALMYANTLTDFEKTYLGGGSGANAITTRTHANMGFLVRPLIKAMPLVVGLKLGASGAGDDIDGVDSASWTDAGRTIGSDAIETFFPQADYSDDANRPFFSGEVGARHSVRLPDVVPSTLSSFENASCRVAYELPNGTYIVFNDALCYVRTAGEDGRQPLGSILTWSNALDEWIGSDKCMEFITGSGGGAATPADKIVGFKLIGRSFHTAKDSLRTDA